VDTAVVIVVHGLHVFSGVFWLGTVLFTRGMLFPALRELPGNTDAVVRGALVSDRNRRITYTVATATVGLGLLRGILDGVFGRLTTTYGLTYLTAAIVGLAMLAWLTGPWLKTPLFAKLYVCGFFVMFSLMVAMRFGY
jgi:hypothetical protein